MSDLIMRAEQGVLGVMLAGGDQPPIREHLTSSDFGHPAHAAVYSAILDLDGADLPPDRLRAVIAGTVELPGVTEDWLAQVAERAPDHYRVQTYTKIVIDAAFTREAATFADPYRDAAATADPASRAHLLRVSAAFDAQAEVFLPTAAIDHERTVDLTTGGQATVEIAPVLDREDLVIADLLQHPDQAREVAAWLDSAVFTSEQRRLVFEITASTGYDGDPIDAVIIAWQVDRERQTAHLWGERTQERDAASTGWAVAAPDVEADFAYVTRLERTTVARGTAVVVGRELLIAHVQTEIHASTSSTQARVVQTARQIGTAPPMQIAPAVDQPHIER